MQEEEGGHLTLINIGGTVDRFGDDLWLDSAIWPFNQFTNFTKPTTNISESNHHLYSAHSECRALPIFSDGSVEGCFSVHLWFHNKLYREWLKSFSVLPSMIQEAPGRNTRNLGKGI